MTKNVVHEVEREVRTFVDLARGADVLIEKSEQCQKNSYFTTMGSLLLTAFTFEAYLNHLGEGKAKLWDKNERKPYRKKYSLLCEKFNINPDHSRRPYLTLKELFEFRNFMAHGRSEILQDEKDINPEDELKVRLPQAKWEKYCTLENAKLAKEDIDEIITELSKHSGSGDKPFVSGLSSGTFKSKKLNK